MGNRASAAASSSRPPSTTPHGIPPSPHITAAAPPSKDVKKKETQNPGSYEELHKKCKDLMPMPFEGFKFLVNKGLSNHFQISHTLNLCTATPSSYHFGATYVGAKQVSPSESYPILLGDIDNSGSLSAQIIHQFFPNVRSKFIVQTQKTQWAMVQGDVEYKGKDFSAALTLGNIDVINESGIAVVHYLQRVTPKLDLGAELLYHYGNGQEAANVSLAGRYTQGISWTAAATLGQSGWHLTYYHRGNDNCQVGVEYEYNLRAQDSCVTLGYQLDIPKANVSFRGSADTNWTVGAVFEKRLQPLPFSFILSGLLNHEKNQSRFGIALQIG